MSSFQRSKPSAVNIAGTKISLQNGQLLTSTGNSYTDSLLGGGLPIGSLLLIEEDKFVTHSKSLVKYFITEGVVNDHSLFAVNLDEDAKNFMETLPQVCKVELVDREHTSHSNDMRIAWRYNSLPSIDSESKSKTYFDSSKRIDKEILVTSDIEVFENDGTADNPMNAIFRNPVYGQILLKLKSKLNCSKYSLDAPTPKENDKNLLRICISSLGSPLWYEDGFQEDVCLFLLFLKELTRTSFAVGCITVPSLLFKYLDDRLIHRIRNLVDYSIELESFAGSNKETNPIFKDYNGLLHIRKLNALNSLAAYNPDTRDLVFKLKRKSFIIEKLHLPPELQEPEPTAQIVPSLSCGSSTKNFSNFKLKNSVVTSVYKSFFN